jgi:hypothetical protein
MRRWLLEKGGKIVYVEKEDGNGFTKPFIEARKGIAGTDIRLRLEESETFLEMIAIGCYC